MRLSKTVAFVMDAVFISVISNLCNKLPDK